ncbi:MAG: undecaprenyl/decaprenyl-phosphate alpha-N-acetylglucosaminyl 1-phosphate transferase [Deltaproteobacteria bacterium]|nr:undecaprenyl/decaprenyl-phosphate alpha-N-acetylglucosaminyl 1-phosphate transferase [Deltaproteobacteria bacterium]
MLFFSTLILSLFITFSLIPVFRKLALRIRFLDIPDERKVHTIPTPRCGGLPMALGAMIPVFLHPEGNEMIRAILIGTGIVVFLGLIDDLKNTGYQVKLGGQTAAAFVIIFFGGLKINSLGMLLPEGAVLPDWLSVPLTLLVIVGVTNAVNLSDGLDGLAAGISMMGFALIGYLAYKSEYISIALLAFSMVGAIFGFMPYNTHPASVFMGDSGSQLLGFLAVTLSIGLTQQGGPLSPLIPVLILGFPVLDTLAVILERITQGRSPFLADKNHFHHKLLRLGLHHEEAVMTIYGIQFLLTLSAFTFRFYSDWFILGLYGGFSFLVLAGFHFTEKTGFSFKRRPLIDRGAGGRFKDLMERKLIKISFRVVVFGTPTLFLATCLLSGKVPSYISSGSFILASFVLFSLSFMRPMISSAVRIAVYLVVPFTVYLSELEMPQVLARSAIRIYSLSFGILALFSLLTMTFTKRRKGFKSTPMNFLILAVALVVPNLPDFQMVAFHTGTIAMKIIVFFFSYEVLIGELRGRTIRLAWATTGALTVFGIKGLLQI